MGQIISRYRFDSFLRVSRQGMLNDPSTDDEKLLTEMSELHKSTTLKLEELSFNQLFKGENDDSDAYIDIQSGSGEFRSSRLGCNDHAHVSEMD